MLDYPGNVIVLDIKGEIHAVTARRRRELGQRIGVLDPFGRLGGVRSDSLNPLDLFNLPGSIVECDAEMLAMQLGCGHEFANAPFWSDSATGLIAGLIAHFATRGASVASQSRHVAHRGFMRGIGLYQLALLPGPGPAPAAVRPR